jgi:hypothetical protein
VIDWDAAVLSPLAEVFGESMLYLPVNGAAFKFTGIFDEAYHEVDLVSGTAVASTRPVCGIRTAEFPGGYDPEAAQDDQLLRLKTGVTYVVKSGEPDGHGAAKLLLNFVSA